MPRGHGAVVHAPVADQVLKQVSCLIGTAGLRAHRGILDWRLGRTGRPLGPGGHGDPGVAVPGWPETQHVRRPPGQMVDCGPLWNKTRPSAAGSSLTGQISLPRVAPFPAWPSWTRPSGAFWRSIAASPPPM